MSTQRPLPLVTAIVLLVVLSLGNLLTPVFSGGTPGSAILILGVLGALGLAGAAGLWTLRRWALWLTIVVSVLNILAAAPGLAFAPDPSARALAAVGVVGFALVIALAVMPASRRAHA